MQVLEMIEQMHARMQVKLARQGMPSDRETLEDVCMAVACLVQDPDGLLLHISPPPAEHYAMVEDAFALTLRDFAEEITALRALVAWLEDTMQEEGFCCKNWVLMLLSKIVSRYFKGLQPSKIALFDFCNRTHTTPFCLFPLIPPSAHGKQAHATGTLMLALLATLGCAALNACAARDSYAVASATFPSAGAA